MAFAVSCNQNQAAAPAAAAAQDSTAVAGSIVFFNMDKVMEGYDMANDLNSVFETKTSGIQAEIDRRGKKLEKDMTDFQNKVDKGLLTTSVAQAQYQKIQQQQQDYQQYSEFVQEYNAEHQYALILTTAGPILSTPVVTGDPKLDITEDLLAGLNAAYIKTKEESKK